MCEFVEQQQQQQKKKAKRLEKRIRRSDPCGTQSFCKGREGEEEEETAVFDSLSNAK